MIPLTPENVQSALSYLSPDLDHLDWMKIGAAVKDALDEDGFDLFDQWSANGANYNKDSVKATWKAIKPNGKVTAGTLFGLALQNGWKPDSDQHEETEQERIEREAKRKAKEAKAERERVKKAKEAVKKAQDLLNNAQPATANHPYLLRKGVKLIKGLGEIALDEAIKYLGYKPKADNELLTGQLLIAPVYIAGKLSTCELIDESGRKTAIAGGIKLNGYWTQQALPKEAASIVIAEGVSTTLSLIEATYSIGVAALSAGNIPNVAKYLRGRYPDAEITIAADIGNGQVYSEKAALENNACLALPEFTEAQKEQFMTLHGKLPTDFNDLHEVAGTKAIAQQIFNALSTFNKPLIEEPEAVNIDTIAEEINASFKQHFYSRLVAEYHLVENGKYLRGRCPECDKKTLWTLKEDTRFLRCDCGVKLKTSDLFPDLHSNLNLTYPATDKDPNRTANAYMLINRGFPLSEISTWYQQAPYFNQHANCGTASVLFWLNAEKTASFEQLITPVTLTEDDGSLTVKTDNFKGANGGLYWQPPTQDIKPGDKVYLCNGIFNAIALALKGHKVIGLLNAKILPETVLDTYQQKGINWIVALGNTSTERNLTRRHIKKLKQHNQTVTCVFSMDTHEPLDWADLYKLDKLENEDFRDYHYYGKLETAHGALEKAFILWNHDNRHYFCFTFRNKTYNCKVDSKAFLKAKKDAEEAESGHDEEFYKEQAFHQATEIDKIATFSLEYLYFQQPVTGDMGKNFLLINFENNSPSIKEAFPGCVLSSAQDFKKAIRKVSASAIYTGSTTDLDYLSEKWQEKGIHNVSTIDYIGYDRLSKAYIFEDFAVEGDTIHTVNEQSFFKLKNSTIKTTHSLPPSIAHQLTTLKPVDWLDDYRTAYGTKGMIVLAWWFGTLFAQQIRAKHRSYPFFELFGEAGSGKSDMVDLLFKLLGLHNMGFNPSRGFTSAAGLTRKTSELANMPICFNETENDNFAREKHMEMFDWAKFLDFYEGRNGVAKGVATNDNKTRMPEFKAALMAIQNPQITGSEAIITRFITVNFDRSHHNIAGRSASDRLKDLAIKDVSGFLLSTVTKASAIVKQYEANHEKHRAALMANKNIKMQRIVHNHAQIMALAECLKIVLPVTDNDIAAMHDMLKTMAVNKQISINQDHPVVQQFWANFEYLNQASIDHGFDENSIDDHLMNHSNNPKVEIAVNLEHFISRSYDKHLPTLSTADLRKYLPMSRSYKYKDNKPVLSRLEKKTMRCWIFEPKKL
jgi:phage/plasmid primase-like uncharacterized protein